MHSSYIITFTCLLITVVICAIFSNSSAVDLVGWENQVGHKNIDMNLHITHANVTVFPRILVTHGKS